MTYNQRLTERVRQALAHIPNVTEKKMFGGIAFMVNGKMCICVGSYHEDDVMVRVGSKMYEQALEKPGAKPTIMKGREIKGYIDLASEAQKDLDYWINLALDFNKELITTKK